jgi:hypothetical protein
MQNMFNSSLTEEYNIDNLIRAYVYNDSESTNLFSYKLGNAGNSFSHLTGIVSSLIGGVEDLVVESMKAITGINHSLFSGTLYAGTNSMVSTWLITRQEAYQYGYRTVIKGTAVASSLTVSLSSLFDFPLKYSVNSTDLLPAMQRFIVGGALVGFIVSSPLTFTAKLIDKLVDRTFPDMP